MSIRVCLNCEDNLPYDANPKRKFCCANCRSQFNRRIVGHTGLTLKQTRSLVNKLAFERMEDDVREVLREEIRKSITQHVRDNVLGAVEVMSHLLPKALAGLATDLEDPDPVFRQRAANIVMKYAMPMMNQGEDGEDARIINIVHNVPIPDTKLGVRLAEELVAQEEVIDDPDSEWPKCFRCHEHKHPHAGTGDPDKGEFQCRACGVRQQMRNPGNNYSLPE